MSIGLKDYTFDAVSRYGNVSFLMLWWSSCDFCEVNGYGT